MNEEIRGLSAINLDEITDFGQTFPDGKYLVRLSAVNGKDPREPGGAGAVEAVWEILAGDYEGMDIRIYYPLKVTRSGKNQKVYAAGISEMKQAFGAVGYTFPNGFAFPLVPTEAAKVYGAILDPRRFPRIEMALIPDQYTDPQTNEVKKVQRKKVLGPAGLGPAAGMPLASTAPQQSPSIVGMGGNGASAPTIPGAAPAPAQPYVTAQAAGAPQAQMPGMPLGAATPQQVPPPAAAAPPQTLPPPNVAAQPMPDIMAALRLQ